MDGFLAWFLLETCCASVAVIAQCATSRAPNILAPISLGNLVASNFTVYSRSADGRIDARKGRTTLVA